MSNNECSAQFLQCYICMEQAVRPRMCPCCSKMTCESCLRKWTEESKSECPHCRKPLLLSNFANCERFLNNFKDILASSRDRPKIICPDHGIGMEYYCQQCAVPICSDCGMFGDKHRQHSVTHLKKIYEGHRARVMTMLNQYDEKIEKHRLYGLELRRKSQQMSTLVNASKAFIEDFFISLLQQLQQEEKMHKERIEAGIASSDFDIYFHENYRKKITEEMEQATEVQFIEKSEELMEQIRNISSKNIERSVLSQPTLEAINEICPKFISFGYVLGNVSRLPAETIYSHGLSRYGLEWRLKIYPKGSGGGKNTHLSVFVELTNAFVNGNEYEYRIEMLNPSDASQSVVKDYTSCFDIGESWGYNKFVELENLSRFIFQDQLHFKVSIRNNTYKSLVGDQQRYIQHLESNLQLQESKPQGDRIKCLQQEAIELKNDFLRILPVKEQQQKGVSSSQDAV